LMGISLFFSAASMDSLAIHIFPHLTYFNPEDRPYASEC
jgi:hypothetical protein